MTRLIIGLLAGLVATLGVLAVNAVRYGPPSAPAISLSPAPAVDPGPLAERLAGALQIQTISLDSMPVSKPEIFDAFRDYLLETFPKVKASLRMEIVADHSMLLVWQGSDRALAPVLFSAHMDVVPPADPNGKWSVPPFSGAIQDGYVWGRGALDMKQALMGYLEAAELLLEEGLVITTGIVPVSDTPVATIGVAQKGYPMVELSLAGTGGHAGRITAPKRTCQLPRSMPTRPNCFIRTAQLGTGPPHQAEMLRGA